MKEAPMHDFDADARFSPSRCEERRDAATPLVGGAAQDCVAALAMTTAR
jgi:hypothetical protein